MTEAMEQEQHLYTVKAELVDESYSPSQVGRGDERTRQLLVNFDN